MLSYSRSNYTNMSTTRKTPPSIETLRELFEYDPEEGVIRNAKRRQGAKFGQVVGSPGIHGYMTFSVKGQLLKVHIAAWAMHHGEWPTGRISHRDGNPMNNRISNLYEVKRLIDILRSSLKDRDFWPDLPIVLTANEIQGILIKQNHMDFEQARAVFPWHGSCAAELKKLCFSHPELVQPAGFDGHAKLMKYRIIG